MSNVEAMREFDALRNSVRDTYQTQYVVEGGG